MGFPSHQAESGIPGRGSVCLVGRKTRLDYAPQGPGLDTPGLVSFTNVTEPSSRYLPAGPQGSRSGQPGAGQSAH